MGLSLNRVAVFIVFFLIILIGGFFFMTQQNNTNGAETTHAETIKDPIKLSIDINKTRYAPGESIDFTVRLTNVGEENITITRTAITYPYFEWRIKDERGQSVFYHTSPTMLPVLRDYPLKPGDFIESKYGWNQRTTDGRLVSSGSYYIVTGIGFLLEGEKIKIQTQIKISIM